MKMWKFHKILSIVLATCLVLCCAANDSIQVFAEENIVITESSESTDGVSVSEEKKADPEKSADEIVSGSKGDTDNTEDNNYEKDKPLEETTENPEEDETDMKSEEDFSGEASDKVSDEDSGKDLNEVLDEEPGKNLDEVLDEEPGEDLDEIPNENSDKDLDEGLTEDSNKDLDEISNGDLDKPLDNTSNTLSDEASAITEKQASGLSLDVSYPAQIKCGTETTFTMSAKGGSGNYQYRIHSLLVNDGSGLVSVYDVSYGSNSAYTEQDTFKFTFYASGTYYIRFSVRDVTTNQFADTGFYEHTLNIQDANYPSVEQIVNTTTEQCLKECKTDFEKAVWLHDWILDNADYDYSYSYCSAEGVLARGEGTCESYHRAYVMLLNKVGIATGRITGNGHVWTAVKMDGNWYQVDSTWDDMGASYKGTYYEHAYFGLTDSIMSLVHSDHKSPVPGYESTALENNYFIKTGEITRWSDPFVKLVGENIASGKTEFSLPVTGSMPDNYKNVIYNLVAYQLSKLNWDGIYVSASYKDSVITVKAAELVSLTITPPSKTIYKVGEPVDTTGLKVTANYTNGSVNLKPGEYQIAGFGTTVVGTRKATITYKGKSAAFNYTVQAKQESISVYNGVDYSDVYDYTYYISKYNDLKQVFGNDQYKTLAHFVNSGMSEGRQGNADFNVYTYKNRYADLRGAFGNDLKSYYMHYIRNGKKEGRSGSGSSALVGAATVYGGVDYSSVYNYSYYTTKYADIKQVFGGDDVAVLGHFVNSGMREGRQGSEAFNVRTYKDRYADLRRAFGNDLKSYYMHYIQSGKKEGRNGSGSSEVMGALTSYNGVDYSSVYNYSYYISKYPDVKKAFGGDDVATLEHFVNGGMREGRQGSAAFNVHVYRNRYADLRRAFGNDLKSYYIHYVHSGMKEGRSGK